MFLHATLLHHFCILYDMSWYVSSSQLIFMCRSARPFCLRVAVDSWLGSLGFGQLLPLWLGGCLGIWVDLGGNGAHDATQNRRCWKIRAALSPDIEKREANAAQAVQIIQTTQSKTNNVVSQHLLQKFELACHIPLPYPSPSRTFAFFFKSGTIV